jgi:hypothetical protein
MTDTRYPISGNIRVLWVPENGLANWEAPTEAELAAALDISDAVSWNDKDFGAQASNTIEDPAITAKGKVMDRGAAQYGGGLSFYYPLDRTDTSSIYKLTEDALGTPGVRGYLIFRVDGLELAQPTGTAAHPGTDFAAGDYVNVYKVETAGYAQSITGEEAFRYTVSFLPKGAMRTFAVVRSSATAEPPVIVGTPGSGAAGTVAVVEGTLVGREYTRGLIWRSSDPAVATVSRNGVIKRISTGTASITATDPATDTPSTAATVTVA